jgi:hypothetical protein
MGYIRHHAIIVTCWSGESLGEARDAALRLGCAVTNIPDEVVNGYVTFAIIPDGSKEGWAESDEGDTRRERFKDWLMVNLYEDGSSRYEWVEVVYGHDDHTAEVASHNWSSTVEEQPR